MDNLLKMANAAFDTTKLLNAGASAGASGAKSSGSFFSKAKGMMPKMPNFHPAIGEAAIGSAVGGAYGYAATDERKGSRLQGALAGAGLGAGAGVALGHMGRVGMKGVDAKVNTINKETAATAAEKHTVFSEHVKPSSMPDEKVYESVFEGKTRFRKGVTGYRRDAKRWSGPEDAGLRRSIRGSAGVDYADLKHDMRNTSRYDSGMSMAGSDMAEDMANTEAMNNLRDKFTAVRPESNIHAQYKDKIFGGIRSSVAGQSALHDAIKHHNDMLSTAGDMGMNLYVSNMTRGFGMGGKLRVSSREQIDAMGKTQAFKDRYNTAVRGATKDFRTGTKGKHFEDNFQQQAQEASHDVHLADHKETLGMKGTQYTTKKEVDRHLRSTMRQHHPDLGGDAEVFKKVNAASSGIKNTTWYEKLAAFNMARVGEAVAGAGIGGGAGYAMADDKHKWRDAAIGAVGGAAISVKANSFARGRAAELDAQANKYYNDARATASAKYEHYSSKYKPSNVADTRVRDSVYKAKTNVREDLEQSKRYGYATSGFRRGVYTDAMRDQSNYRYGGSAHGDSLAEEVASKKTMNDFKSKFVDDKSSSNVHGEFNNKMFGGFRGAKKSVDSVSNARMHAENLEGKVQSMDQRLRYSEINNTIKDPKYKSYNVSDQAEQDAARKTQEFKDRFGKASREGVRDARTDTRAKFKTESAERAETKRKNDERWKKFQDDFEEAFNKKYNTGGSSGGNTGGGAGQRRTSYGDISAHKDTLGMSGMEFNTKKEVDRHIRGVQRKNHPDLGGDEQVMKNVNNANDAVRASSWYEKLASFQGRYGGHA